MEACFLYEANASFTKTSANFANLLANSSSFASSPEQKRKFSIIKMSQADIP